jgi:hypothetical protein
MTFSLGDIIATLALLMSGYATWRSHRFKKKEEDLLEVQKKLNALILEKEEHEATEANRAELGANFITFGSRRHRLKIFNKGKAVANQVEVDFPDGNDVVIDSDIQNKFPMESMEPGQSVELIAAVPKETKRKLTVRLIWQDKNGEKREKLVYPTL